MNNIRLTIEQLIKNSVSAMGQVENILEDVNFESLYSYLKRHSITAIGYDGLVRCGVDKALPVMQQLFKDYITAMMLSERQMRARDKLFTAFEEQGIDYLPLKGCTLKELYPKPELRAMGDADILIREEQYPEIKKILESMGFVSVLGADHTFNWKSTDLYVELHRRLVPVDDRDYLEYFGDGWSKAKLKSGHRYEYSKEDEFIFVIAHFARHFRLGGIGYRQFADLWVYSRSYPDMDDEYILSETEKLGLKEFYENTMRTISACFEAGEKDEKTEFISTFIFNSGNWGNSDSYIISQNVKTRAISNTKEKNVKLRTFFSAVLPSLESLAVRYRILEKYRWLAPAFQVVRWFDIMMNRRKNIGQKLKQIAMINEGMISERQQLFESIGLTHNFEK